MQLLALGLNHHTAPVSLRERVAFPFERIEPALAGLKSLWTGRSSAPEAAILSTCNRTEIYCVTDDTAARERAVHWLSQFHNIPASDLAPHLYALPQSDAVRHAFRVASGLDSMVLGETQILGQLKDAVRTAAEAGALGTYLNQLFQRTFAVAKEVRGQTEIGAHSVSMAAAAVRLAQRIFESISTQKVLFIGAGEMIDLCATHFAAQNPKALYIANRTAERGEKLAERTLNGRLGILGGLSVLGTTGIVIPYSCSSWIHSIHRGIDVARAAGQKHVLGATGSTSEDAAQALYHLPDFAVLDMGDFAGGVLKYLRDHPIDRLTIAGGFAKLTKLAQGALDLHSARSQVDMGFLADLAEEAGAPGNLKDRILFANTAKEALEMTQSIGVDLATPVALKARETARATLRGAAVEVEIIVTDREGKILARV